MEEILFDTLECKHSGWNLSPIINKQGEGMEKECCGWEKIEKLISGGTSIRYSSVGTKFGFKMTLLKLFYNQDIKE